jgi:hypothetical protein
VGSATVEFKAYWSPQSGQIRANRGGRSHREDSAMTPAIVSRVMERVASGSWAGFAPRRPVAQGRGGGGEDWSAAHHAVQRGAGGGDQTWLTAAVLARCCRAARRLSRGPQDERTADGRQPGEDCDDPDRDGHAVDRDAEGSRLAGAGSSAGVNRDRQGFGRRRRA